MTSSRNITHIGGAVEPSAAILTGCRLQANQSVRASILIKMAQVPRTPAVPEANAAASPYDLVPPTPTEGLAFLPRRAALFKTPQSEVMAVPVLPEVRLATHLDLDPQPLITVCNESGRERRCEVSGQPRRRVIASAELAVVS